MGCKRKKALRCQQRVKGPLKPEEQNIIMYRKIIRVKNESSGLSFCGQKVVSPNRVLVNESMLKRP